MTVSALLRRDNRVQFDLNVDTVWASANALACWRALLEAVGGGGVVIPIPPPEEITGAAIATLANTKRAVKAKASGLVSEADSVGPAGTVVLPGLLSFTSPATPGPFPASISVSYDQPAGTFRGILVMLQRGIPPFFTQGLMLINGFPWSLVVTTSGGGIYIANVTSLVYPHTLSIDPATPSGSYEMILAAVLFSPTISPYMFLARSVPFTLVQP